MVRTALLRIGRYLKIVFCRLDRGDGKDLSLPECPRQQLEEEVRITLWDTMLRLYLFKLENHVRQLERAV